MGWNDYRWRISHLAGSFSGWSSSLSRRYSTIHYGGSLIHFKSLWRLFFVVIILCCCVRIRIPRTKQEIEADFRRKQLSKRFKQELKRIRNSELDVMDLRRGTYVKRINLYRKIKLFFNMIALDRVRADFHSDTESFCGNQSDIFSSLAQGGAIGSPGDHSPVDSSGKIFHQMKILVKKTHFSN